MSERGRAALSGLAVAVLFALPLLAEILGARRLVFRDAQITHWPWRRVAEASLAAGEVPFVNASASGGEPLLANPNAVLLYPTMLLEKTLAPAAAFNLHYLLHVVWAYLGARRLARALGQSEGAAFFSGVAYAFSGAMLSYASAFANSSAAAAWLPWCGAAAVALARARERGERARSAAAAALALGLQLLAGEPAISMLTLGACAVGGAALAARTGGARAAGRFVLLGAGAAAAAAAFAAPLLLPLRQIAGLTYRGQHLFSLRAFGAAPFALWRLPEWLFPRWPGDPGLLGAGGHWQYDWHRGDIVYLWSVTFGVLPLLVAVFGAARRDFWDRRTALLAIGAAAAILLSFGSTLPFYRALGAIEALRRLRYPIKFYLLATVAVALLAGFGLDRLAARPLRQREAAGLAAVALLFAAAWLAAREGGPLDRLVAPALSGLAVAPDRLLPAIRRALAGDAAFGIAAVAAIALVRARGAARPLPGYLLGFAALVLALPWALPLFVSADEKDLDRPPALAAALHGPGRLYVSPLLPEFNVMASGTAHPEMPPLVSRLARVQIEELIPDTGSPFGVRYLFDGDPDGSYGWYNRIASEALTVAKREERVRLLRAYSGRWILADERETYPGTRVVTGMTVAGRRLVLSEIPDAVPELRWAGRARYRRDLSGAVAAVKSPDFDPAAEVVLPGPADRDDAGGATARLRIDAARPGFAAAAVEATASGVVVLSRTFFPAWKATVDGRPARVFVANAHDLAVAVPAGAHRVELAWDARPFRGGVALQAAVLLLIAAASRFFASARRPAPAGAR